MVSMNNLKLSILKLFNYFTNGLCMTQCFLIFQQLYFELQCHSVAFITGFVLGGCEYYNVIIYTFFLKKYFVWLHILVASPTANPSHPPPTHTLEISNPIDFSLSLGFPQDYIGCTLEGSSILSSTFLQICIQCSNHGTLEEWLKRLQELKTLCGTEQGTIFH